MMEELFLDMGNSLWIDGLQRKWKLFRMAIPEIIAVLDALDTGNWSNMQGDRSED